MKLEKIFQKLGYKYKEAKIYLAALRLGESSVSDLAAKTKMPRSSVVSIIEKLRRKGLMNYYRTKLRKYWVAENPEKLMDRVHEREETLQSLLPTLKDIQHEAPNEEKPSVQIYTGVQEVSLLFDDILSTKKDFCAILAWQDLCAVFGKEVVDSFLKRQREQFLNIRIITPDTEQSQKLHALDSGNCRETRFFSKCKGLDTAHFIYGNKTAIISLKTTFPTAFVIDDPSIRHAMEILFEALWEAR